MGVVSVTRCAVWAAATALLASGCPGRTAPDETEAPTNTTISVEVEGDTTPAVNSSEPFSLPEPPAADPNKAHLKYLSKLEGPIQARWRTFLEDCRLRLPETHVLNDASLQATLEIDLNSEGKVTAIRNKNGSGNPDFDQVALEIIREIGAFPRPPQDAVSDDAAIHLVWKFSRGTTQAGVATAELAVVTWPPQRSVPRLLERGELSEAARRVESAAAALDSADTMQRELLIGLLNDVAIEAVRGGLASEDPKLQRLSIAAARTGKLATLGPELVALAKSEVDVTLRYRALRALGRVQYKDAAPLLVSLLEGGTDPAAAAAVSASLSALGETKRVAKLASEWLASEDDDKRWAALAMLSAVPNVDTVRSLRDLLNGKNPRAEKLAAASALGAAATIKARGALKGLMKGLRSKDAAVRAASAQAIYSAAEAGIRSSYTFHKLVPLLSDKDERVRAAAVSAAARLDPKRFSKEIGRLGKETSGVVLGALARVLGGVPGKQARGLLLELAAHSDVSVRRSATRALVAIDDEAARAAVEKLLEDEDFEVRLIAVGGLRDVEALARYLDHESPVVRAAALNQLVAEKGKGKTLTEVSRRLATATLPLDRVLLSAAWLSR